MAKVFLCLRRYQSDIDFQKLKLHLQILPDAIKAVPLNGIQIRQVTLIQTICDVFNEQSSLKECYQKYINLYCFS